MANNLTQTKWADHVRGCADLAKEIATRLDIRDDPARQACFATIMIDAGKHNIFMEPIPEAVPPQSDQCPICKDYYLVSKGHKCRLITDPPVQVKAEGSASPVPPESRFRPKEVNPVPRPAPARTGTATVVDRVSSLTGYGGTAELLPQRQEPPKGEVVGENLGALRDPTPEQAESASRGALLKGINSARELLGFTPKKLNEYIQEKLKTHKTLGVLDVDELADLTERLSKRIDAEKQKAIPDIDHRSVKPPPPVENVELEDWP